MRVLSALGLLGALVVVLLAWAAADFLGGMGPAQPSAGAVERAFDAFAGVAGSPPAAGPRKFAVGLNSCVDLIVPAIEVFAALGANGMVVEKDHDVISSMTDLQETFRFFFMKGGAGERFVSDKDLFQQIVAAARGVQSGRKFVGGNAALMGLTIKNKETHLAEGEEVSVLMGGGVGPELNEMLGSKMAFAAGAELEVDDYHVILEYPSGGTFGGVTSPRANRFIISHDVTNSRMETLEVFEGALSGFSPDVVILSGLHMLEGESKEFRSDRVDDFVKMLKTIPKETPIHLELASMALEPFIEEISQKVFPHVDSIGLNEQELELVSKSAGGPHESLSSSKSVADTAMVGECLYWMLTTFGAKEGQDSGSRLTRIHFHSLTFHIIAHVSGTWTNSRKAVVAGSWACTTRACGKDSLSISEVNLRLPMNFRVSTLTPDLYLSLNKNDSDGVSASVGWVRGNIDFRLAPVYVCRSPGSTVGLGDTISATGLFYSMFV